MAIMARVKPHGEKRQSAIDALTSPKVNSAFSLRGITVNERINGVWNRIIEQVVTFDLVYHPGLAVALKYSSPALESLQNDPSKSIVMSMNTLADIDLDYKKVIAAQAAAISPSSMASESSKSMLSALAKAFPQSAAARAVPSILQW